MAGRNNLINNLFIALLFIALEVISIFGIYKTGIIQEYAISKGVREVKSFFWEGRSNILNYFKLAKENQDLVEENSNLQDIAYKYWSLLEDLAIESLKAIAVADFEFIPAAIVKNSPNRQHNYLVLNKGEKSGVARDMGVVTEKGVIGVVISVSSNYSLVLSFLNEDQSFGALIKSSNIFSPISWDGESAESAVMREIPLHIPVSKGDTIVTSGYSAIFPPDIPIGTIESSKIVNGVSQEAKVRLFENFRAIKHVYIVKNRNAEEIDELFNNGVLM